MLKYFFLLLLISCATTKVDKPKKEKEIVQAKDYEIRPGEVTKITFPELKKFKDQKLYCKDRFFKSYVEDDQRIAYISETYFSKMKPFTCKMGKDVVVNFKVVYKKFKEEKLKVDKKMIYPPKKARIRIAKEQKFLSKVYAASGSRPLFTEEFRVPLDSYVTSVYGNRRLYNNKKQSQHLGTDYRAAVGVPITSANAGRVVVARNLYYTGNTVTIDHGLGIFTIYGHLSELNAVEGEYVPKNALIGKAGATGRVTGPHLHWGVKVNGHFIEGDSLVRESEK